MPLPKELYGSSRPLPQSGERNWGNVMTQWCSDVSDGLDGISLLLSSGVVLFKSESTSGVILDDAGLTVTHPVHYLEGDDGAGNDADVVLNATTAIVDGDIDGQHLLLFGANDSATVTIPDGANTALNGLCILDTEQCLHLRWDEASGLWQEITRRK